MRTLFLALMFSSQVWATPKLTFRDSYSRYLSGHDIFRVLAQKFPTVRWDKIYECSRLTETNRPALGIASPANGEMTYKTTSATFVKWLTKCAILGISKLEDAGGLPTFVAPKLPLTGTWNLLEESVQLSVIVSTMDYLIGPGMVADEKAFAQRLRVTIDPEASTLEAIKSIMFFLILQDEFLTY